MSGYLHRVTISNGPHEDRTLPASEAASGTASGTPSARRRLRLAPVLPLLLATLALPACITRTHDEEILNSNLVTMYKRHQTRGGTVIDHEFAQPAVISAERLTHILALIDVKTGDEAVEERTAAIATPLLEPLGKAMSAAMRELDSSQQLVVLAIHRKRNLKLFTRRHLTSFVAFVKGEDLFLDFSRVDWEVPKKREDRLPRPELGNHPMKFRLAGSQAMRRAGPQTLAIDWRNDMFSRPLGMRSDRGETRRRTVLMETPSSAAERNREVSELPSGLSPDQLRQLADLEQARVDGEITELEYRRSRKQILQAAGD